MKTNALAKLQQWESNPESRTQSKGKDSPRPVDSPSPFVPTQRLVWHHLTAGLAWLSPNDFGRPWPNPRRSTIARLVSEFDRDLCVKAAREAREIVIAQDRAPNITALFEKKLRDLAGVRETVRDELGATDAGS